MITIKMLAIFLTLFIVQQHNVVNARILRIPLEPNSDSKSIVERDSSSSLSSSCLKFQENSKYCQQCLPEFYLQNGQCFQCTQQDIKTGHCASMTCTSDQYWDEETQKCIKKKFAFYTAIYIFLVIFYILCASSGMFAACTYSKGPIERKNNIDKQLLKN